ncbi:MAG: hypothetical protein KA157_00500 [Aliarcobacter sp.]|nr:hypothetical protein [Aliarcobacter sp.]
MNRLNPLYILLSIIIINILTYAFLEDKKDIYFEKIDQSEKLELKIKEYTNVTNFYKNLNFINKTIDEILNSPTFRTEDIIKISTKETILIKFNSMSHDKLDNFINKILNKQLIIKKLELEQNSINLEVGLK